MKANVLSKYRCLLLAVSLFGSGCAAQRPASTAILASTSAPDSYYENAQKNVTPAAVATVSKEATYGVTAENPVKVGGGINGGVRGEQSYLNALRGPSGQPITYRRQGSCCPFKTPNGLIDNTGMLDAYTVTWEGNAKPLTLYINMYDKGDLFIPVGLTAAQ
ncbi:hypothetical protein ACFSDX_09065 [Hymenobacter bucti]|uniref:2-dehydro-3-deoxyphosphooctonate aldolase n=1 Tax=Hymenobacter bucti TaxID=1844114 RepID=A0ABW4QSN2_9BACT